MKNLDFFLKGNEEEEKGTEMNINFILSSGRLAVNTPTRQIRTKSIIIIEGALKTALKRRRIFHIVHAYP